MRGGENLGSPLPDSLARLGRGRVVCDTHTQWRHWTQPENVRRHWQRGVEGTDGLVLTQARHAAGQQPHHFGLRAVEKRQVRAVGLKLQLGAPLHARQHTTFTTNTNTAIAAAVAAACHALVTKRKQLHNVAIAKARQVTLHTHAHKLCVGDLIWVDEPHNLANAPTRCNALVDFVCKLELNQGLDVPFVVAHAAEGEGQGP